MKVLLFAAAALISGFAFYRVYPSIRSRRRRKIYARAFPAQWVEFLEAEIPLYRRLPRALRPALHGHINVLLKEKIFEGCGGLELDEEKRLVIAALAAFLLLNRETGYFPGFRTILVYPDTFVVPGVEYDGPIQTTGTDARSGESWKRGPIVLSWEDIRRSISNANSGYNVVLHEFAHKLDEENAGYEGLPLLSDPKQYESWAAVLSREYQTLRRTRSSVLDPYGATSPAEFFAVATEAFFQRSTAFRSHHRALYDELAGYYRVDPARWDDSKSPGWTKEKL